MEVKVNAPSLGLSHVIIPTPLFFRVFALLILIRLTLVDRLVDDLDVLVMNSAAEKNINVMLNSYEF